jgi:hypothetical protein
MGFISGSYVKNYSDSDKAAKHGYLWLVKRMHKKGHKCTQKGANMAIENGHLDIIKFLYKKNINSQQSTSYIYIIAEYDKLHHHTFDIKGIHHSYKDAVAVVMHNMKKCYGCNNGGSEGSDTERYNVDENDYDTIVHQDRDHIVYCGKYRRDDITTIPIIDTYMSTCSGVKWFIMISSLN